MKFKAAWIHFLGDGFPVIAGTAIMSTGNRKMKNGNWQNREWDGKLLIGLEFNLGFVLIFHFSITRSRSPFLFPVPRFPFRVFGFPFPVPCSPFPVSRSSFPVPCSLSLFHVLVKSFVVLENLSVPAMFLLLSCCSFFVLLYQHLSVMEDMLKDFMLGEHLLLVGNQVE